MKNNKQFSTKAIHIGSECDPVNGSVIPGIFQISTYVHSYPGEHRGYDYTRCTNPTRKNLEDCLASLELSEYALTTSSGLAAITCVLQTLPHGANILCGNDVYGGTYRILATTFADRYNVTWVDTTNAENVEKACRQIGKVDLFWVEAISNPLLKVTDIKKVIQIAKQYGAKTCVDSTFLTPYLQNPLTLGADIVVHSLTKYINGHSDVLAGGIFTNSKELYEEFYNMRKNLGPSLSPFDAWLILRGVKTLSVRMEAHQTNALKVAEYLKTNKHVEKVLYPGLKEHINVDIIKSQCTEHFRGGGMLSFYIKGDLNTTKKFLNNCHIFRTAESLGGIESLAAIPSIMTHGSVPVEIKNKNGITDNLIRLSVGIENVDDMIADLDNAFKLL